MRDKRCSKTIFDNEKPQEESFRHNDRARCIYQENHEMPHGATGFGDCELHSETEPNVIWFDEPTKVRRYSAD